MARYSCLVASIGSAIDHSYSGHNTAELFSVMIFCPLLMNTAQVLIQDLFLKFRKPGAGSSLDSAAYEPLNEQRSDYSA